MIKNESIALKDLIKNSLSGDLDSFNQIILQFQGLVYNQAFRIVGESDTADDAVQEAFISAYKKLHTYRGGSFKSWLLRIVSNVCYDEFRRRKRQPVTALFPDNDAGEEMEPSWLKDDGDDPEGYLLRKELSEAIQICLDRLDIEFRTVVVLIDIQGMDYSSAAEIVDRPLGTIKSRLARARRNLQDCLQGFRELLPAAFRHVGEV